MVNAKMVKDLRDRTSAGIMDCKKALEASEGDIEKAIVWLRERGISKAEKKAGCVAAEGLCSFKIANNRAVVFELNSQTDFVAKNEKFLTLLDQIGEVLINSNVKTLEEALKLPVDGKELATVILEASGIIGEKIELRRLEVLEKEDSQIFGAYSHMQGRIVTLVVLDKQDETLAKDIAMHIAATNPRFISKADIPASEIEKEREIILHAALNENKASAKPKPDNIIAEKIVPGRLDKSLKDICLLSQQFVKNPDQTVEAHLAGVKVLTFSRLEVGEGIEKEVVDFAAEVAAQAGLK